jgi:hypothetical protein
MRADATSDPVLRLLSFRHTLSALMAALVTACTSPTAPLTRDIRAAHARWQHASLRNYAFTSSLNCFCAPEYTAPMIVTVQSGVVTSIISASTGTAQLLTARQSVDSIFANLERQAAESPALLTVQFDATYGYPTHADFGSLLADAGYSVSISDLRALP